MQYYKDKNGFQPLDLTWILQSSHRDMIKDMKATSSIVKTDGHVRELSCKLVRIHIVGWTSFFMKVETLLPRETFDLGF